MSSAARNTSSAAAQMAGGTSPSAVAIVTTGTPPAESAGTLVMRRLTYREYDNMLADPDRMSPQFNIGLDENYLPAGIVRPENQDTGGGVG